MESKQMFTKCVTFANPRVSIGAHKLISKMMSPITKPIYPAAERRWQEMLPCAERISSHVSDMGAALTGNLGFLDFAAGGQTEGGRFT
jgi:hypothetical protein